MNKLLLAALLASAATPVQSALIVEMKGNATTWLVETNGLKPLSTSSATLSGICGSQICEFLSSPLGFSISGFAYHAYGFDLSFIWSTPPEDFFDGLWHSGLGEGTFNKGYVYPGVEITTVHFTSARLFDDGEWDWGDELPWLDLGPQYGVPEPATWAMAIGGFALVGASLRRRKLAVSFA